MTDAGKNRKLRNGLSQNKKKNVKNGMGLHYQANACGESHSNPSHSTTSHSSVACTRDMDKKKGKTAS